MRVVFWTPEGIQPLKLMCFFSDGSMARASVPSGASTGAREAVELRDGGSALQGKGVLNAVQQIRDKIFPSIKSLDPENQTLLDRTMCDLDGTSNKSNLGANSILAVSLATAKAVASCKKIPFYKYLNELYSDQSPYLMPLPMMNILNGGAHANNNIDIQEFMIQPIGFDSFSEALWCGVEIFHALRSLIASKGMSISVGDEGGFAPNLDSNERALDLIAEAIDKAGFNLGKDVVLALDCAASEFFDSESQRYLLKGENRHLSREEWIDFLTSLIHKYPIASIEDAMDEDDREGWKLITDALGNKIQLVGDDVFVTNPSIFKEAIADNLANAILIKPNQIGTLSETFEAIRLAQSSNYATIISHRSGETEDTSIADLSVATHAGQIKTGSLCRTDRSSKYNQLLRIESMMEKPSFFKQ